MQLRKRPQLVQLASKNAGAMNITKQQRTGSKCALHRRSARRSLKINVKKEEDDYKDALNALQATSNERNAISVSTTRVKTEIKQEETDKAALQSTNLGKV
ncbi:hypothetical protein MBANPS3_011069 [Mucor bainieri]